MSDHYDMPNIPCTMLARLDEDLYQNVQAVLMVVYVCQMCAHKPFHDVFRVQRLCSGDVR